jgi:hypothetical protein
MVSEHVKRVSSGQARPVVLQRRFGAILVAGVSAAAATTPALARAQVGTHELALTGAGGVTGAPSFASELMGPAAQVAVRYGLSDLFSAGTSLGFEQLLGETPDGQPARAGTATELAAGLGVNLDVLTVVPFLHADLVWRGEERFAGDPLRDGLGVRTSIGADYRRWRTWSVGLSLAWTESLGRSDTSPDHASLLLRVSWIHDFAAVPTLGD